MGVRTFLSNDVHILSPEKEEIDRWRMMLSLKNDKWMEDDYSYKQYGMKTGEEIKTSLCGFWTKVSWKILSGIWTVF